RHADRVLIDFAVSRDQRLEVLDKGNIRRGAAHVDRDRLREAERLADLSHSEHASRGPRQRELYRMCLRLLGTDDAAARLHAEQWSPNLRALQERLDSVDIVTHLRLECRTQRCCEGALVLADLRQHFAREGDLAPPVLARKDLANLLLMAWVDERPQ